MAALTLFRLSQRAGASLLAASLQAVASPGAAPRLFDASLHSGSVLRLAGGLFYVEFVPASEARARGPATLAASQAAARARTFAVAFGGSFVLAHSATEAALNVLLANATAAPSALKRRDVAPTTPTDSVRSLATHVGAALPALLAAIATSSALVVAAARAEGLTRDARSLMVRAHGHLLCTEMQGSVAWDAPASLVPATAWLRGWSNAALQAAGVVAPSGRPSPRDPREMAEKSGWRRRTKAEVYPFVRVEFGEGEVPTWDVAAVCDMWEAIHGPLTDPDDWMWTVFAQMRMFEPVFDPALHARLAASSSAVKFPGTDAGHTSTPLTAEAESVKIPEQLRRGINGRLSAADALAAGNCISNMIFVPKTKLRPPDALAAVLANDDGRATPDALRTVARAAHAEARAMVAELAHEVTTGMAPSLAADVVFARRGAAGPVRACHDGRALSEYISCVSPEPQTVADLLRVGSPTDVTFAADFSAFYYTFVIDPRFRRFYVQRYVSSTGEEMFFSQNRVSMGVRDSGIIAQAASAVCAQIAMSFAPFYCVSYIDDMMGVCAAGDAARASAALSRAMELCVPGGGEAVDKRVAPATINTLIGQRICLSSGRIFIELKRYYGYMLHLFAVREYLSSDNARVRAAVTSRSTERLVGKLSYLCEYSLGSRVHLHGLYRQNHAKSPPCGHLRDAILSDVNHFATMALAGSLPVAHLVQQRPSVRLHTRGGGRDDGSGRGPAVLQGDAGEPCGAALHDGHAVVRMFTAAERGLGSDWREMATTLHGFKHFLPQLCGRSVLLVMDHSGNAFCINKGNAASPSVAQMIRELFALAATNHISVVAVWCPREANQVADRISKCATVASASSTCAELGLVFDGA